MKLRPYQQEGVHNTIEAFRDCDTALGVAATGLGKTVVFAHLIHQHVATTGSRAMVIAHREELVNQAAAKIKHVSGIEPDIEMAERRADVPGMYNRSPVVIASVQTLSRGRIDKFDPQEFGLLVIDEAHHAVASSYKRPIDHILRNDRAKVFGVTATPDRSDEMALGRIFDRVSFDFDVDFGVEESWLVPIRARSVPVDSLDFSRIRSTCGDLNEAELAMLMEAEGPLHEIAHPTVEITGDRKSLVFAVSVAHAEKLAEILNRYKPDSARWVCGATPKDQRRQLLSDFAARKFQYLVNVGVLTEGFDDPSIECVVLGRPTESRALFAQMIGRGTRPIPQARIDDHPEDTEARAEAIAASAKPNVEIIDFVGNAGNHVLVCMTDILGGDYDADIIAAVKRKAEHDDIDIRQALEDERELREHQKEMARQAELSRRRELVARAEYSVIDIDPFDVLGLRPIRRREWDRHKRLSQPMIDKLRREGVANPEKLSFIAAKRILNEIFSRKYAGKPTYKQAAALKFLGHDVPATAGEASRVIDQLRRGVMA